LEDSAGLGETETETTAANALASATIANIANTPAPISRPRAMRSGCGGSGTAWVTTSLATLRWRLGHGLGHGSPRKEPFQDSKTGFW